MKAAELMTAYPYTVSADSTLQDAAASMRDLHTGVLPVCEDNTVIGMVTDRDITVRATAEGKDPRECTVREIMTDELICCYDDEHIHDAGRRMLDKHVGRLVVLNRAKQLVGILSLSHIVSYMGGGDLIKHGPINDFA